MLSARNTSIRVWYVPYAYGHTVRVWYTKLYHTRMVHTVRVWYVPYAYGIKYAYGTEHYYSEKRDHEIFWNSRIFYHGRLNIGQNPRSHESFIPRKFGAIRYTYNLVISEIGFIRHSSSHIYQLIINITVSRASGMPSQLLT